MSKVRELEFENYNITSKTYDSTRVAVGIEKILKPLITDNNGEDWVIGDFGCGTFNYGQKLANYGGTVIGVDFNLGMLDQAKQKMRSSDNVSFKQASLIDSNGLPFDVGHFDMVVINQVIHHLEDGTDQEYRNILLMLKNISRVIRVGGWFSLSMCTQEQADGFWWQHLIPDAKDNYAQRHIPTKLLKQFLKEAGFELVQEKICKEPLQGIDYYNVAGPMNPIWRQGDSIWATVSNEKLEKVTDHINNQIELGQMGAFFDEYDSFRKSLGQSTFFICRRVNN